MKNKILTITLAISLLSSFSAIAMEGEQDNFTARKAQVISNLNQEKAIVDQTISCANSAQKKEDLKSCHEKHKASMDKLKGQREAQKEARKDHKMHHKSNEMENPASAQ